MEGIQLIELWFVGILSALRFDTVRTTLENCSSKKDRRADFRSDLLGFRVRTATNRFISHRVTTTNSIPTEAEKGPRKE